MSLWEPHPWLGFPETSPGYLAMRGTWAVATGRLEVGTDACRVGGGDWSGEVGSVTGAYLVNLAWGGGMGGCQPVPEETLRLRTGRNCGRARKTMEPWGRGSVPEIKGRGSSGVQAPTP